jgi:hypothetical protein
MELALLKKDKFNLIKIMGINRNFILVYYIVSR